MNAPYDELLERAEANGWSTRELREEVNRRKFATCATHTYSVSAFAVE